MKIKVLGSAAGGGLPQWNCNCANCAAVRRGDPGITARTQSSLCISENDRDWVLLNASPDILQQIRATPELQPARALRDSGIVCALVTDAQIDHTAGLLLLRERQTPLPLHATPSVWAELREGFPLGPMLSHYCGLDYREIPMNGRGFRIPGLPHTRFTAVPLSSAAPPYSPNRNRPAPDDNIGLLIENETSGAVVFYAPGLGQIDTPVREAMAGADLLLIDGTFWQEDEMMRVGLSTKSASDMGHLPQSGPTGMIAALGGLPDISGRAAARQRKVLIHINNTNPILRDDSPERRELDRHGIEVAVDGMTFCV
ncbi:coenzyme PQQ synthesis protein B (plasmid) [Cupriavidus necator N-1]|uniref:Coenzyme PQQ synthesis protein B n=1 Tax=Cupriavidus necator (strain ATCC 43291 / DSM 13513 / CCUG 52238 / LMG 8453 / N-1) TaxID=1042878 RepID=F8GWZ0_CUPNN|nr:pyrroloquinoline quinone biosynthesis protein PqqB [Cupriavidus necator]AEI81860.1 coenzyme PQQ synthesis protein B [Cupriavidus necator N-1]MDX6008187.1 pyrroloquinoline quinone biosynthesis protein PqqB [Cupriavidus necator]